MASTLRPDLARLSVAVDELGAAFAELAVETFDGELLLTGSLLVNRASNMIDGVRADLARKESDLRPPGALAARPGRRLDPKGQRPSSNSENDSNRADLFGELPGLGDATRRGDISGAYADALGRATGRLSDAERAEFHARHGAAVTERALESDLHAFGVYVRGLVDDFDRARELERFQDQRRKREGRLWNDPVDGMVKLFARFDPETGARVRQAINAEIDRIYRDKRDDPDDHRSHEQIVADVIAGLILGAREAGTSSTELVVLVDLHTLITDEPAAAGTGQAVSVTDTDTDTDASGPTAAAAAASDGRCCETSDGTALPVATIRRLACDAGIVPAVLNGDGVVVDFGRSRRLASPDQRKVLRTMYTNCAFNDCTTPFDRCEIHHVDPWGPPSNGRTDIGKLVPACQRHHHAIHDHHLRLSVDPESRTMTVTHPDGTQVVHPLRDRRRRPPPDARTA